MRKPHPASNLGHRPTIILAVFLAAISMVAISWPASAQDSVVQESSELTGVQGTAQATVTVAPGEYATLMAVAEVSGGKPVGNGVIARAGVGVDIYVDDKICAADRDIRRQVNVQTFQGKFATSTTCMTVLKAGTHTILAARTSIHVEGSKMVLKHILLGGEPEKVTTGSGE